MAGWKTKLNSQYVLRIFLLQIQCMSVITPALLYSKVLNGLTAEDESVVDVWYLLGLTNKLRADFEAGEATDEEGKSVAEGYNGNARYYLKKALRVQAKNPSKDKQMVAHVKELLGKRIILKFNDTLVTC